MTPMLSTESEKIPKTGYIMRICLFRGCCAVFLTITVLILPLLSMKAQASEIAVMKSDAVSEKQTEEALREILTRMPDRTDILEQLAFLLLERGDIHNANETYSHLLNLSIDDTPLALRYAVAKWHLQQEYEAHAALIATAQGGVAPAEDAKLATAILANIYDPDGLLKMIRAEITDSTHDEKIQAIDALWQSTLNPTTSSGTDNGVPKTAAIPRDTPYQSFVALWRGYRHINSGENMAALGELKTVIETAPDSYTAFSARAGIKLLEGLESHAEYRELINTSFRVADDMPGASREQSGSYAIIDSLLGQLHDAAGLASAEWGAELVREINHYRMDEAQRGRYLYFLGELWENSGALNRAVQSFQAAQVISSEESIRSDARLWLARNALKTGDREKAIEYAELSAEAASNNPWRRREVGDLFMDMGLTEEGISYYEAAIPASTTPETVSESYSALLALYERLGDKENYLAASDRYIAALDESGADPDKNQRGLGWYYRAQSFAAKKDPDQAYEAYAKASELLTDSNTLSDAFYKMAEYESERGNLDRAAEFAEKSAEKHPVDWNFLRNAHLLFNLDFPEKAFVYFDRAAKTTDPDDDVTAYAAMADAYASRNDSAQFFHYAGMYVDAVAAKGDKASGPQKGIADYYEGRIVAAQGKEEDAYRLFERSSGLLTDVFKLSDAYLQMGEYRAQRGDRDQAARLAEKSLAILPDEDWKIRQVADFYVRHGMQDKAVALYEDRAQRAVSLRSRAEAVRSLADLHNSLNNRKEYLRLAQVYRDLVRSPGFQPTANEQGLDLYFQGEILTSAGDLPEAHQKYANASRLLTDDILLSDVFQKMAHYEAIHGDKERAAEFAEKSADKRPEEWVFRRTADFLFNLNMPEKAYEYYDRSIRMSNPDDDATAYAIMADAYTARNDAEQSLRYGKQYVDAIAAKGADASGAEKGLSAYYQGKAFTADRKPDDAYLEYERASGFLVDKAKLSEVYILMAEYSALRGDKEKAAEFAEKSLAALPDEEWKVRQVADLYVRIDMPDRAVAVAGTPGHQAELVRNLAELHKPLDNQKEYLRFAGMYRDIVTSPGYAATDSEKGLAAYYQGDILSADKDYEGAHQAYIEASHLLSDDILLSDAFQKMAVYERERGDKTKAAEYAEKSADKHPVDWVYRRTADFLFQLDMPDRAVVYYDRLAKATNPDDDATAYSIMADAYAARNDMERYLHYAGQYVEAIAAMGEKADDAQQGLAAYYQGKILDQAGKADEAYQAYERASALLADNPKLADAYILMAEYDVQKGDREKAVEYAGKSLAALPNEEWKIRQVANLYGRVGVVDKAVSLADKPRHRAELLHNLAGLYKPLADSDEYLRYARQYLDIVTSPDYEATDEEKGFAAYYQGEILSAANETESAHEAYVRASGLLADDALLSDVFQNMAEYEGEHGDRDLAAEYSEKSAEKLPQYGIYRRTADFLFKLNMPEKAFAYYDKAVKIDNPDDDTTAYAIMADAYADIDDTAEFLRYANRYVQAVAAKEPAAADAERGLAAYYQGKILADAGKEDEAYSSYERASALLDDMPKRSEAYFQLAEYDAARGDRASAVDHAARSLAILPDEDWKIRQIADLYIRVGMSDKAVAVAETPRHRAEVLRNLAEMYKTVENQDEYLRHAGLYRDLVLTPGFDPTNNEKGMALYYEGELLSSIGNDADAQQSYEQASELLTDSIILSNIFYGMAEYQAKHGDRTKAAAFAEKSAETLPADWNYRRAGDFLLQLNMPDKAFVCFDRSAKMTNYNDDATAHAIMADAYIASDDQERFRRHADQYVAAIAAKGDRATDAEKGIAFYYRGKMLTSEKKPDEAYPWYEAAIALLTDNPKLADAYSEMAYYNLERGDKEQAVALAEKSLAALPDEDWKRRQVADIYVQNDEPEKAVSLYRSNVERADTPKRRAEAIRELAELHKRLENEGDYLRYAGLYRDIVMAPGFNPTDNEKGLNWYYQGEIQTADNDLDLAHASYEQASYLLTDNSLVADVLLRVAEYEAEKGTRERTVHFVEQAVEKNPVDWVFRRAGDIMFTLDMPDKALAYFQKSVKLANPNDDATAYAIMADAFSARDDQEQFIRYARSYVDAVAASASAADAEKGLVAYYRGKILTSEKKSDEAYTWYQTAVVLLSDKPKLADAYIEMAEHDLERGDKMRAAALAEKSLATLPDEDWKRRQVADIYVRVDQPEKAIALYSSNMELADTPKARAEAIRDLAELHKRLENEDEYLRYAGLYRDIVMAPGFNPTDNEKGLSWYYQGEIQAAGNNLDLAHASYEQASYLLADNSLRADVLLKVAEYEAEKGTRERTVYFVEQAVEKHPVDWVFRRAGDIVFTLDMPDKAFAYFEKSAKLTNPNDDVTAYAIMADVYAARGDQKQSVRYARLYVKTIAARVAKATDAEKGLAAYYRGRIYTAEEQPDEAYRWYERASHYPIDKPKLAEAYMLMAEHHADRGEREQAAALAMLSLAQLPDEEWKIRQVADLYYRIEMRDEAISLMEAGVKSAGTPRERAVAVRNLAEFYKSHGNQYRYLLHAGEYRDIVTAPGFDPTPNEQGLAWFYQGEIQTDDGELAAGYHAYIQSTRHLTETIVLSDAFLKMAGYEAQYGEKELAAAYADTSAAKHPAGWTYRRTGDLVFSLQMIEEAFNYFVLAARKENPADDWTPNLYMAEAYSTTDLYNPDNRKEYLLYGCRYAEAIAARHEDASKNEKGFATFYRGRFLTAKDNPEEGQRALECAATLITEKHKLFEVYGLLSQYMYDHYGEQEKAVALVDKGLALLPNDDVIIIQAAARYLRLDALDKTYKLYEDRIARAETPKIRAKKIREFADYLDYLFRKKDYARYAGMYRELVLSPGYNPSRNEQGLASYYHGEILTVAKNYQQAHQAYTTASRLLTEKPLLSDVLQKMAEYEEKQGNGSQAAQYTEMSAEQRPEEWVFRRTADLLLKMKMPDKALDYYDRSVKINAPEDDVTKYSLMADAYRILDDMAQYACYAAKYINTVAAMGENASDAEKGIAGFYRGRLLDEEGEYFEAYRWYDWASYYITDKGKLCETYRLMAQYKFEKGESEKAAELIEKALAVLPDEVWLLNHVANFYVDLDTPEIGLRHFEKFIARDRDPRFVGSCFVYVAEIYRRIERWPSFADYACRYVRALSLPKYRATNDERGEAHYYLGEISMAEDRPDEAIVHYRRALPHLECTNRLRLADVAMRTAEHHTRHQRRNAAAKYLELSAAYLWDSIAKQIEVGGYFVNLDMIHKTHEYFNRARALAKTPEDRARVYDALANFYKGQVDTVRYIRYANLYIKAVNERGKKATLREIGTSYYYVGEIHTELKQYSEAYAAYERAIEYFRDPQMLSTVYFRLAKLNIKWGKTDLAAQQALTGAGLLPTKRWVVAEAMGLLADAGHFREAEEIAKLAIYLDPENKYLYQSLARIYFDKIGNRKVASAYHKMFIDHLYEKGERRGRKLAKGEYEELWYARGAQNGIDRTWGLESTFSGTRWNTGDYYLGMSHQLYRNYQLRNGWWGKLYVQYGGTLASQFSSYHWINDYERLRNVSSSNLGDSGYLLFGATVHPFKQKWLRPLEFWGEYSVPLGKNVSEDLRVGVKYSLGDGDFLRPFGNLWKYWKVESNTWYSFMDKEVTSIGEIRRGFTYVNDCDRNLLFIPNGVLTTIYDSRNKSHPWGMDAGVALTIKKFFREDRYHLPQSAVELNVGYLWPLTSGRDPYLGATLKFNF